MPTAIISTYTPQGFMVASDGLGTKTRPEEPAETSVQKIFPINYPGRVLAYALMGNPVISADAARSVTVVDIPSEISRQAAVFQSRQSKNLVGFVTRLCQPVNEMLKAARSDGSISGYPSARSFPEEDGITIARVLFVGYFDGKPAQVRMRFHADITGNLQEPEVVLKNYQEDYQYGSDAVATLVMCGDPYFKKYSVHPDHSNPLRSAGEIARHFIDAWGDPRASEIDPANCRTIGGQTQVYTVTVDKVDKVWPPPTPQTDDDSI